MRKKKINWGLIAAMVRTCQTTDGLRLFKRLRWVLLRIQINLIRFLLLAHKNFIYYIALLTTKRIYLPIIGERSIILKCSGVNEGIKDINKMQCIGFDSFLLNRRLINTQVISQSWSAIDATALHFYSNILILERHHDGIIQVWFWAFRVSKN